MSSFGSGSATHLRLRRRRGFPILPLASVTIGLAVLAGVLIRPQATTSPAGASASNPVRAASHKAAAPKASETAFRALLDAGYSLGPAPLPIGRNAPLQSGLQLASLVSDVASGTVPAIVDPQTTGSLPSQKTAALAPASLPLPPVMPAPTETSKPLQAAPLPIARPSQLRLPPAPEAPRVGEQRAVTRQAKSAPAAATAQAAPDDRNFLEKLFGVKPREPGTQLAYAAPQGDLIDRSRGFSLSPRLPPAAASMASKTAVYDIRARTVYMPNGEKLVANSGLGEKMNDLRYVHVRMHGPTPPHVYDLTEREALFHGVRAIRMHPVGGPGKIFGRTGLLVHSYLLGPRGDSNGCVSVQDYDRFLQAFLRGEVKRLIVVGGDG